MGNLYNWDLRAGRPAVVVQSAAQAPCKVVIANTGPHPCQVRFGDEDRTKAFLLMPGKAVATGGANVKLDLADEKGEPTWGTFEAL